MTKITNSIILSHFRKKMELSKIETSNFANEFQTLFEEALLRDKVVKISGLGTFKLIPVEARRSVNVNTGENIEIAQHYKLTFTPESALKDIVNQPFAHLETTELGEIEIPVELDQEANVTQQEDIESPLQKLTEQALELKDILADIADLNTAPIQSIQHEVKEESFEDIKTEKEEDIVPEISEKSEHNDISSEQEAISTPIQNKVDTIEPNLQSQQPLVSAKDIIAEINKEDSVPENNKTGLWLTIVIFLSLTIIALLLYQNRNFFFSTAEDKVIVNEIDSQEQILSNDVQSFEEELPLEVIETNIDTTSAIYSAQFSDIFNIQREYTEFIDTIVLNEGSRLTWISFKQYGHKEFWVYIYEANRDIIANPNEIKIGTELRIPKLDEKLIDIDNPECLDYAKYLYDIYVKK